MDLSLCQLCESAKAYFLQAAPKSGPKSKPVARPDVEAAKAAVDAAAARLPPESELTISVMETSDEGYAARGGSDPTPPNHGSVVGLLSSFMQQMDGGI